MTPAEELRTAAEKMRSFPGPAAAPIADWLDSVARRISLDGADWNRTRPPSRPRRRTRHQRHPTAHPMSPHHAPTTP